MIFFIKIYFVNQKNIGIYSLKIINRLLNLKVNICFYLLDLIEKMLMENPE